jgi:hypothetical protein
MCGCKDLIGQEMRQSTKAEQEAFRKIKAEKFRGIEGVASDLAEKRHKAEIRAQVLGILRELVDKRKLRVFEDRYGVCQLELD